MQHNAHRLQSLDESRHVIAIIGAERRAFGQARRDARSRLALGRARGMGRVGIYGEAAATLDKGMAEKGVLALLYGALLTEPRFGIARRDMNARKTKNPLNIWIF
jgi:hypothetical protein